MTTDKVSELLNNIESWDAAVRENGFVDGDNRVTIKEAFMSNDAPILFPKIVSNVLREAAEPIQLITPLLDVVRITNGRSIEIPAVNSLRAFEVPEGQEFPEDALAFAEQREGKVTKKGLKVAFTEEVIADSQWDIVGLHVRAAARAMARLRESIALSRFRDDATVVFDNSGSDNTTGLGMDGNGNDSLSFEDVIDMAAALLAEDKAPTDFIIHPLMWAVFLKNSFHFTAGGAAIPSAWNGNASTPEQAANANAPLGINTLVSPFVGWTPKAGGSPAKSDVFLIDRNDIGVNLIRDDMSIDEWDDNSRDIRLLKFKERYDVFTNGSENITVAKDVALVRNYEVSVVNNLP